MKYFVFALLAAQAALQINAQVIRTNCGQIISSPIISPCSSPCSPVIAAPSIIQTNSVANSLADTLSLLTVSSLLAETLPLNPNVVAVQSGCGCGLGGIGLGGLGYGGYYY